MRTYYYPTAIASFIAAMLSVVCFLLLRFNAVAWIEELLITSIMVSALAVLTGLYSVTIKKSWQAPTELLIGLLFFILYVALHYSLKHMCVIC
ncbi:hypothetical protein [Sphingobacterium paludis]|nr:hypothetical protein [Sphingobacterium paludis]